MFTNHSALKYLVNKPVLGGKICRWILLFQEYEFEIIVKIGRLNARLDHLSRIKNDKEPTNIKEGFPNAQHFAVRVADNHFTDIISFFATRVASTKYTSQ